MNEFAPQFPFKLKLNGTFKVKNIIQNSNKTIKIFDYPIPVGMIRDILKIPGVAEDDVRASLLKGELRNKILAKEIEIVESDVELIQFNTAQTLFLSNAGVVEGLTAGSDEFKIYRRDIVLDGVINGVNTIFTLPIPDTKFIVSSDKKIIVYLNGVKQKLSDDYLVAESGGPGAGYDRVIFIAPPFDTPDPPDVVTADYYIE